MCFERQFRLFQSWVRFSFFRKIQVSLSAEEFTELRYSHITTGNKLTFHMPLPRDIFGNLTRYVHTDSEQVRPQITHIIIDCFFSLLLESASVSRIFHNTSQYNLSYKPDVHESACDIHKTPPHHRSVPASQRLRPERVPLVLLCGR